MSGTMQFDLVSPERSLASGQASSILIPGADGDMVAMPDHAPVVTGLRPGIVAAEIDGGMQEFVVTGGFAQITMAGATVLADEALPKAEATSAFLDGHIAAAQESQDGSTGATADEAAKRVADLEALKGIL
ncbi:MAG: F0F1 ATP synthase subunit epsilon [Boseongicola sp.]|nr:F0F1 ATP synthase subunit epsilon [Boseongicola sp.]